MSKEIGVGIVGLGWVAEQYIKSFLLDSRTKIMAVCDLDKKRAIDLIEKYNLKNCEIFTNIDDLLMIKEVTIVCVLTPNFLHAVQAIKVAESGKNLILEKPIAINFKEAVKLNSVLRKSKIKNIVGFVLRWNSLFKNIKEIIEKGIIGKIFHIEIDYMLYLDNSFGCYNWCSKKSKGGSILTQSGCHAIDGIKYFIDSPVEEVIAISSKNRKDFDHETSYSLMFRFKNGATGKLFCSYDTMNPYIYNINIYGSNGSIRNNKLYSKHTFPGQIDWVTIPSIMPDTANVEHHPFPELVSYFVDCIIQNKIPIPNIESSMHVFEIIEAAEISAKNNGEIIALPFKK